MFVLPSSVGRRSRYWGHWALCRLWHRHIEVRWCIPHSKVLGFMIMMSSEFEQIKTIKILYYTYIRSHLEYVSQVWNPVYDIYINQIERIQKRFLRYLQFRLKKFMSNYSVLFRVAENSISSHIKRVGVPLTYPILSILQAARSTVLNFSANWGFELLHYQ